MKRLLLMTFLGFSFAQETYYCVQLGSFMEAKNSQELFLKVKDLPQARVEKIEGLYKLLVGFYENKTEAQRLLEEAKNRGFKDAFLKTCYYIPSRIIISNFQEPKVSTQTEELGIKDSTQKEKPDEELYRLLVQSLLSGKKLNSALKVIKEALSYFPKSPYWWKLYGDVLLWTSQPQEALEAYLRAYELSPSKSLAERIFNLTLSLSRFDVAQRLLDKVEVPPKVKIYVYKSTGDVESLINYLKELKTKEALILLTQIQFSLGEKEEALKALELHDELYGRSADSVLLRANILFSEKRHDEALRVLKENYESFKDDTEFLRTLSDLAWMLGDYDTAWKASERLVELGKGEDGDYERLGYKYAIANPKRVIELSLEAYEKFKRRFFLEFSIFTAFNNSLWKEVIKITERYKDEIFKSPYTFIAYAAALDKLGKTNDAMQLIEDYLTKNFSKEVLNFYIYLVAEKRDFKKLRKVVWDYRRYEKDKELALAFAYAYAVLQNGIKALEIYKASPKKDEVIYSDILYLIGKEEEARYHRFKTYRKLQGELKTNPELLKNPEFLRTYLSLGLEFTTPAEFEKVLQEAKKLLSEAVWQDIYLSYLFYTEQRERVERLARIYKYPLKPWMWLNLALANNDKILLQELIEKYAEELPTRDRVEILRRLEEPYKALYYAFLGLEDKPEDYRLYKQFRDLAVDWASNYEIQSSYYAREDLKEWRTTFSWKRKLGEEGTFGLVKLFYGNPLEKKNLSSAPERKELIVGLEKYFTRGKLGVETGLSSGLKDNPYFSLYFSRLIRKKLLAELRLGKNERSEETLYLYLGGMKDYARLSLNYPFTNRLSGYFSGEYAIFRAQDETRVGRGTNLYGELSYKLRLGYPDYTLRAYTNYGNYSERSSKGVLQKVSPFSDFKALPEDFFAFGVGFLFGYENRYSFVRVWRPFMSVDFGYSTGINGFFLGGSMGIGGLVFGQDNLSLSVDYVKNTGGVKEGIFNLNLFYRRWY